jgi:DNA repair exonuclease SbcCD ATPase subunit
MGRGAVVDRDELFETANRLEAEGKDVTALSVHKALGRGSLTTIYKYLEEWKSTRPGKTPVGNNEMPDLAKTAFAAAWRTATQEAARETEAAKEKAAQEVEKAQAQFQEALGAIDTLTREHEAMMELFETFKSQFAEVQARLSDEEKQHAAQKAAADELRQQLKDQQSELERLRQENDRERAEKDTAAKEAAELKGRADELKKHNGELLKLLEQKTEKADKPETSSKVGEFPRIRTNEQG